MLETGQQHYEHTFLRASMSARAAKLGDSMVTFRRHNKLSFSAYMGTCQEIRSESGLPRVGLNLHIRRHSPGKLLPSQKFEFLS